MKELEDFKKNQENDFWEEGYFAETMGPKDIKEKMRNLHMKHDEEMDYDCKKMQHKNFCP